MTDNLAKVVSGARMLLKSRDEQSAEEELSGAIRQALAPLETKIAELPAGAREKFREVHACLDQLESENATPELCDSLDLLMLGLWIRMELLADSQSGNE